MPHPLETHLNFLISTDTRPPAERDVFQKRHGQKRTQIQSVKVLPVAEAGALPTKQVNPGDPTSMGNTTWGTLKGGPLTAEAINQGNFADCYMLIAMYLIARLRPNFFDDIFVAIDDKTAVVQWFWNGVIIQVTTSLLISTDGNRGGGDIRPELAEKTLGLIRSGVNDMHKIDMGNIYTVFYALGLDNTTVVTPKVDVIAAAMAAGKPVGIQTTPTATGRNSVEDWVASHAYGFTNYDPTTKLFTMAQPWKAARQITGVDQATIEGGKVFNYAHCGQFPATSKILASMVNVPTKPPVVVIPEPMPPAVPVSPTPTPTPEKPMNVVLKNKNEVLPLVSTFPITNGVGECRLTWTTDPGVVVTINGGQFKKNNEVVTSPYVTNFTDNAETPLTLTFKGSETITYTINFVKDAAPDVKPDTSPNAKVIAQTITLYTDGTYSLK